MKNEPVKAQLQYILCNTQLPGGTRGKQIVGLMCWPPLGGVRCSSV